MPIAFSWAPLHADMHLVWCCARAYHREQRRHAIPIALAASHCPTARDFVPWRFLVAGRFSAWSVSSSRRPKTCTLGDIDVDYSTTSSAVAKSDSGTVKPSALAIRASIMRSYLFDLCTGRSAVFVLKMRLTQPVARSNGSVGFGILRTVPRPHFLPFGLTQA